MDSFTNIVRNISYLFALIFILTVVLKFRLFSPDAGSGGTSKDQMSSCGSPLSLGLSSLSTDSPVMGFGFGSDLGCRL